MNDESEEEIESSISLFYHSSSLNYYYYYYCLATPIRKISNLLLSISISKEDLNGN